MSGPLSGSGPEPLVPELGGAEPPLLAIPPGMSDGHDDRHVPAGSTRRWPVAVAVLVVAALSLPLWAGGRVTAAVVDMAVVVTLAQWWALLAGRVGVVSLAAGLHGGVGVYGWLALMAIGVHPVPAVVGAIVAAVVVATPTGWVLLRLPSPLAAGGGLLLTVGASAVAATLDDAARRGHTIRAVVAWAPLLRRGVVWWLALVLATCSVVAVAQLARHHIGLTARAWRDDPEAAAVLGVRPGGARLVLWLGAAAAAGAAGVVPVLWTGTLDVAGAFDPVWLVAVPLVAALLGGTGSWAGPVVGAVAMVAAQRLLGTTGALALGGVAAAAVLVTIPNGLAVPVIGAVRAVTGRWWRSSPPVTTRSGSSTTPAS